MRHESFLNKIEGMHRATETYCAAAGQQKKNTKKSVSYTMCQKKNEYQQTNAAQVTVTKRLGIYTSATLSTAMYVKQILTVANQRM